MSQSEAILTYLLTGASLTPLEALDRFGCLALHSRAAELRRRGHNVRCTIRQQGTKRWGEYSLA